MRTKLALILIAGLLLSGCNMSRSGLIPLTGGPALPTPPAAPQAGQPGTLRYLASQHGLLIGSAVNAPALQSNAAYSKMLAQQFNVVVPENAMKFRDIHPALHAYNFTAADQLVNFAIANGMLVRGHTLLWYREDPQWLTSGHYTKQQLLQILHDHITTIVSHFKGRVFAWDVVNEEVDDSGKLRDNIWLRTIGPQYIDYAFEWAHEADPNALLFYNDYNGEGLGTKSDAIYNLVKGLRERGIPIGGIGLQMHVTVPYHPSMDDLKANMGRLAGLGLVVHITELDVRLPEPVNSISLQAQAQVYHDVAQACLEESGTCQALVLWGFTDRYSPIPGVYPHFGSATITNASLQPKPAYNMLMEALSGH